MNQETSALNNLISQWEHEASAATGKIVKLHPEIQDMPKQPFVPPSDLIMYAKQAVCEVIEISMEQLQGKERFRPFPDARYIAFHIIKSKAPKISVEISLKKIGEAFGGRDHTTVIHGLEQYEDLYTSDPRVFRVWADKAWIKFNLLVSELLFKTPAMA